MRMLEVYDRLERVTLGELEQTRREIAELNQGECQPPDGTTVVEELARLKRYEEYLLGDLRHIRERRAEALRIMEEYAAQESKTTE